MRTANRLEQDNRLDDDVGNGGEHKQKAPTSPLDFRISSQPIAVTPF